MALLCLGALTACIDDSDPVFGEKLEITVGNVDKDIRTTIGSTLSINPTISPEDREYDCYWGVANRNNTYSVGV